jgi:uncharacterized ferredoxin-like protein
MPKPRTIPLDHEMDPVEVILTTGTEGAEYIAEVMEREADRTGDVGARRIAQKIRRGLS